MENKFIGVTFVFYKKSKSKYHAIQSSYIFKLKPFEFLKTDILKKAEEIIDVYLSDYVFLGISDLYMTEKLDVYNYLGRTSFYKLKDEEKADSMVLNIKEINQRLERTHKNYKKNLINVGFVYFNKDAEGKEFNSTIIVYTVIKDFDDLKTIYRIAEGSNFKNKIVKFSIENLNKRDLKFKGISDFYYVKNEGLFESEGVFESKEDIIVDILSWDKELKKELDNIYKDYLFVK